MNPLHAIYGVIVVGCLGYIWHCESVKEAQAVAIVLAEQAKDAAEKQAAKDRKSKEKADAELKNARSAVLSLARQLRDARGAANYLPPASPTSRRPDLACFDRALLEQATRHLDEGLSRLAEGCDQGAVDLANARKWARDR